MGLFGSDKKEAEKTEFADNGKLLLRKEELDISKDRDRIGEVALQKEIIEEKKRVDVPVTHEEVVIERRDINNEFSNAPIGDEETIHIPVSKEEVHVDKDTFLTGEISAHKREVEEKESIEETLKHEEARVRKSGDPNIIDSDNHLH